MKKYTMKDWEKDNIFNANPGQEVDYEIYEEMYNVLPPMHLATSNRDKAKENYGLNIVSGFLVSEPYGYNEHGSTYSAFGKTEDNKYYFLGYLNIV